jgi:hypothetical protein
LPTSSSGPTRGAGPRLPERVRRVLAEPALHFFAAGLLLFAAHRLFVGDPRTITVTPGVRAEVGRRLRDHTGRTPTSAELEAALSEWKRDEALYREALRQRLDRDDSTVRTVLADKMRERAAVGLPKHVPTNAELQQWLASHRNLYETPRRYDYESLTLDRSAPAAEREIDRVASALDAGAEPASLGRPVVGGTLTVDEIRARFDAALAGEVAALPLGTWRRIERQDKALLVRVRRVEGGLPSFEELRPRLAADFTYAAEQRAIEQELRRIVERYRFEERP